MKVEINSGNLRITAENAMDLLALGKIIGATGARDWNPGSGQHSAELPLPEVLKRLSEHK